MIQLKDVSSRYVFKNQSTFLLDIVKDEWGRWTEEQKKGWYATSEIRCRFNAQDVLEHSLDSLCEEGYEDMYERCLRGVPEDFVPRLQSLFDELTDKEWYIVLVEGEEIDPNSEVPKNDESRI